MFTFSQHFFHSYRNIQFHFFASRKDSMIDSMMDTTEQLFRETHNTLNNHHYQIILSWALPTSTVHAHLRAAQSIAALLTLHKERSTTRARTDNSYFTPLYACSYTEDYLSFKQQKSGNLTRQAKAIYNFHIRAMFFTLFVIVINFL